MPIDNSVNVFSQIDLIEKAFARFDETARCMERVIAPTVGVFATPAISIDTSAEIHDTEVNHRPAAR